MTSRRNAGAHGMTADVVQAVEGLQKGLRALEKAENEAAEPQSDARKAETNRKKQTAKTALARLRAELDAVLLGDPADS